jgi:hypothetical protein
VRDGQPSPHRPRLVVSRSTCPPISPPPPRKQLCTRSCSNKHTHCLLYSSRYPTPYINQLNSKFPRRRAGPTVERSAKARGTAPPLHRPTLLRQLVALRSLIYLLELTQPTFVLPPVVRMRKSLRPPAACTVSRRLPGIGHGMGQVQRRRHVIDYCKKPLVKRHQ